jgi:putative flippase GtrA
MTDLSPRPNRTPSRRTREERAYRLALAGGAAAVVAVVTLVLAIIGPVSLGVPVLAAIVAAICVVLFQRTVS